MNKMIIVISSFFYVFIRLKKNMQILQQNYYNENNRYIKWGFKHIDKVFNVYDLIILMINIINIFIKYKLLIWINLLYILFYFIFNNKLKKEQIKLSLVFSMRIIKLFVSYFIFVFILLFVKNVYLFNVIYSLIILFNFYLLYLINIINMPIDKLIYVYYYMKMKSKLKTINNLEIVGITGSYGKTSSKNFLNQILNVRFNSITTPYNYNTKYGIILTVNKYINKFNDIFIAEMGAFKKGSIKKLCKMVKPKYGIITKIGNAHMESFGNIENIQKAKFELIDSLPFDGVAILNADDKYQVDYKIKSKCKKIWIGINNNRANVMAKDIKIDDSGMYFKIYFKEEDKEYDFYTKLLGYENIYNILDAVAFGKYKGLTIKELQYGVRLLKPISHRLELKKISEDKIIIDDAYNSNPVGSKMALDVLDMMKGIKIIVTPGMIELGKDEYIFNKKFGEYISKVCNYVILVGKKQTEAIYDGLKEKRFNKKKIYVVDNLDESFKLIDNLGNNKVKYILLENDLPDIFNE